MRSKSKEWERCSLARRRERQQNTRGKKTRILLTKRFCTRSSFDPRLGRLPSNTNCKAAVEGSRQPFASAIAALPLSTKAAVPEQVHTTKISKLQMPPLQADCPANPRCSPPPLQSSLVCGAGDNVTRIWWALRNSKLPNATPPISHVNATRWLPNQPALLSIAKPMLTITFATRCAKPRYHQPLTIACPQHRIFKRQALRIWQPPFESGRHNDPCCSPPPYSLTSHLTFSPAHASDRSVSREALATILQLRGPCTMELWGLRQLGNIGQHSPRLDVTFGRNLANRPLASAQSKDPRQPRLNAWPCEKGAP